MTLPNNTSRIHNEKRENGLPQVAIRMVQERPLISNEKMDSPKAAIHVMSEFLSQMDRELVCVVNVVYIGIRCYVKDWLEERGYY